MPINGSNNQKALVRDERGRWAKGFHGGPGRPLGSRNKLSEDFLVDMHVAWLERGQEVIDRLIAERPEIFLMAMLKIAQVHRVEVVRPERAAQQGRGLAAPGAKRGTKGAENAGKFPGQSREARAQ